METPTPFVQQVLLCFNVDRVLGSNLLRAFLVAIALQVSVPDSPQLRVFEIGLVVLGMVENTYLADRFFVLAGYQLRQPFPKLTLSRAQVAHDALILLTATAFAMLPFLGAYCKGLLG